MFLAKSIMIATWLGMGAHVLAVMDVIPFFEIVIGILAAAVGKLWHSVNKSHNECKEDRNMLRGVIDEVREELEEVRNELGESKTQRAEMRTAIRYCGGGTTCPIKATESQKLTDK